MSIAEIPKDKKVLCIIGGLPYSGKTTFGKYLSETRGYSFLEGDKIDMDYVNSVERSPAAIAESRRLVRNHGKQGAENILVSRATKRHINATVRDLRRNNGVVTESAYFIEPPERKSFLQTVRKTAGTYAEAYWMEITLEECLQRHKGHTLMRGLWIPGRERSIEGRDMITEEAIRKWHAASVIPSYGEGFDKVFLVRGISPTEFDIREQDE